MAEHEGRILGLDEKVLKWPFTRARGASRFAQQYLALAMAQRAAMGNCGQLLAPDIAASDCFGANTWTLLLSPVIRRSRVMAIAIT